MDDGKKRSLCTTKSPLLFLICSDFKVQKSVFIPGRTPSVALSHISFVGLQTNRQQSGVEGPARLRFDKLDFAMIDAESTAETKSKQWGWAGREDDGRMRRSSRKKRERQNRKKTEKTERKNGIKEKCLMIFICIFHFTRIQAGRMATVFINNVRLLL